MKRGNAEHRRGLAVARERSRPHEGHLEAVRAELQNQYEQHYPDASRITSRLGDRILPSDIAPCAACRTPWPCRPWYAIRRAHAASFGHNPDSEPRFEPLRLVRKEDTTVRDAGNYRRELAERFADQEGTRQRAVEELVALIDDAPTPAQTGGNQG